MDKILPMVLEADPAKRRLVTFDDLLDKLHSPLIHPQRSKCSEDCKQKSVCRRIRGIVVTLKNVVEEISKDFEGKIKVFKLNTDENPNVASQYGIRSIPTLMIFKGGQKVDTVVGAVPKATLSSTLTKHL